MGNLKLQIFYFTLFKDRINTILDEAIEQYFASALYL